MSSAFRTLRLRTRLLGFRRQKHRPNVILKRMGIFGGGLDVLAEEGAEVGGHLSLLLIHLPISIASGTVAAKYTAVAASIICAVIVCSSLVSGTVVQQRTP